MNLVQILTNENPAIISLITIMYSFPEAYLYYKLFYLITKKSEYTKKRIWLFIASMTLCGILSTILPNSLLKDILVLSSQAILIKHILKTNIKTTFITLICSYVFTFVSDYASLLLFMYIFKISYEKTTLIPIYLFSALLISLLFMCTIIRLLYFISRKKDILKPKLGFSHNAGIITNIISGIITLLIETYLFTIYLDSVPLQLALPIVLATLIYFCITLYTLLRTNKLEKTQEELENEKTYNKTLTLLHDNIRGFKHDFNNIVQAIGGYVALNDMNGLKDYYNRLLEECKISNNLNLLNPEAINNPSIYSLLTNKYFLATEKGISINFSIFSDLSKIQSNNYEISRIIGILLDNAIEAAEETTEKTVSIEITSDEKKHLFIIENSFNNPDISTTKIFEKGYSTKSEESGNSGLGLWNVHKILSKNTNLDLYTTTENNMFRQEFSIYYK